MSRHKYILMSFILMLFVSVPASATLLHYDRFEYVVNRVNDPLPQQDNPFVNTGGWTSVKAENLTGSHAGWLFTTTSIPGYTGAFPGQNSSRVLKTEAINDSGADFYLQYGSQANDIPGDVWFQFWIYIQHYGTDPLELNYLDNRHKFIYPCNVLAYPCSGGNNKWLINLTTQPLNTLDTLADDTWANEAAGIPFGYVTPGNPDRYYTHGETFLIMRDATGGFPIYTPGLPGDTADKLGPNELAQGLDNLYLAPNQWYLIKIHLDTSVANNGKFESWMMPLGGSWRKTHEWISGVTPNFTWPNVAGGHMTYRMPSTIGWEEDNVEGYSVYYIDDWAMATTEADLPTYGGATVPVLLSPISGVIAAWPVDFNWTGITGATMYHIQVDDNPAFSSPAVDNSAVNPSTACVDLNCHYYVGYGGALSPTTHYYWRVRALRP